MVHLGFLHSVKFKIKTYFSWKWEKLYELELCMLMFHWFYGIVETAQSCWRYFKSVDKTKKMCWEVTTSILHVHNIVTITYIYCNFQLQIQVHSERMMWSAQGKGNSCYLFPKNPKSSSKPMKKFIKRQYPVLEIKLQTSLGNVCLPVKGFGRLCHLKDRRRNRNLLCSQ